MTELEDRLRDELSRLAQRARPDTIRPLSAPAPRRRDGLQRWLAPIAATAAVITVATAASVAGLQAGRPAVSGQPAPSRAQPGTMPPFYVTAFQSFEANGDVATFAAVHDSVTGAALTTVDVPTLVSPNGGTEGPSISAAADDRTFLITELSDTGPRNFAWFFRLKVAADGRSAQLSKLALSMPGSSYTVGDALSPDGRRLAVAFEADGRNGRQYAAIRVVSLATGAALGTWTTTAAGFPSELSWAGEHQVAFRWQHVLSNASPADATSNRLLDVTGAGSPGSLLSAQYLPAPATEPTGFVPAELVTANGKYVITSSVRDIPSKLSRDTIVASIVELSARTGQVVRVLFTTTQHGVAPGINGAGLLEQECNVLSLAPTGISALVSCYDFGRVTATGFTALAGFPSPASSGIAGQEAGVW